MLREAIANLWMIILKGCYPERKSVRLRRSGKIRIGKWVNIAILGVLGSGTGWAKVTVIDSILLNGSVAIAVNPTTNKIYVTNFNSNNVSVIYGATDSVVATIAGVSGGICANSLTNNVYVTNIDTNIVSVIDGTKDSIVAKVFLLRGNDAGICINETTNTIYVADVFTSSISIIDGTNDSVVGIQCFGYYSPCYICVNPVTNKIYVANRGIDKDSNNVLVMDGKGFTWITRIAGAFGPICVNSVTNRIYVANDSISAANGSNTVSVIDGTKDSIVATIAGVSGTICVNPVVNRVYVANYYSNNVSVIDGTNDSLIQTVTVGNGPEDIAVNPKDSLVYASCAWGILVLKDYGTGIEEQTNLDFGFRSAELKINKNPFIKSTVISYTIPPSSNSTLERSGNPPQAELTIYDLSGRCVKILVNEQKTSGAYTRTLNANELKTGIYFLTLSTGTAKITKKLTVIK